MPRRTTGARAKDSLSVEEQAKRDKVDLLLKDLEVQAEQLIMEKKREIEAVSTSITTMYKLALMKIPSHLKNAPWDTFMESHSSESLNVSLEVETQVQQIKSAIKSTRKPRKAALANTAVRASARKRIKSADANLETPASSRSRRNVTEAVTETPLNTLQTPFTGRTPMITPKFDPSQLTRTVRRMAKENEVAVSLNGSPIMPYLNPKSKAWTAAKTNLAQVPLMGGQTLNLPMDGFSLEADSVDDLQLKQLEELTRNLQQSVANIKASRGKEN